ncbi:MAG: prepilin-type N-terminal cleavage/methylation domain-containing protein [Candidatus Omnitrophica bacterium]|nr:prepilin-type N-terminal cleavage/methylation domain-containing protein [Candidatus Omnitrophota bacterium]
MFKKKGFTLLEILVVIIIIGILATLALPQYMKTTKKARVSEATSNIGSIRGAEIRHYQEYDTLVIFSRGGSMTGLDIEDLNDSAKFPQAYFEYEVTSEGTPATPENMIIRAYGKENKITKGILVEYKASTGQMKITLNGQPF